MLKRILVGLGGSDYTASAIRHAIELARAHDAEITGVSILDAARLSAVGPVPLGAGHYAQELMASRMQKASEHIEAALAEFETACATAGVRYSSHRETGEPFALLVERARYHDIMVFGLRGLFEFDLIPDPHDALVRLVESGVRPILAVAKSPFPVKKALIAYSGSMESAKAMKRFVQMRLWPAAPVRIITFAEGKHDPAQLLADAAAYCAAHGLAVETELVAGRPQDQLLSYAQEYEADLTVVGNSAKNLLLRRLFGETALTVIKNAQRPLFLSQ